MVGKLFLLVLISLSGASSYGQCTVDQDSTGQIVTTCQYGGKTTGVSRYLGSEYLTFPIWQNGAMVLGTTGRQINGQICYNVYTNQVFCQLDDSTTTDVFPDAFTINDASFVKRSVDGSVRVSSPYYLVRYQGATKLLEGLKCTLEPVQFPFKYLGGTSPYAGQYKKQNSYYVQKGSGKLSLISLTKSSLLTALYEQSEPLDAYITTDKLTLHEAIGILIYYDSLMATRPVSEIKLNDEPIFRELLHEEIQYPNQAWNQGIYGRVYIGFTIDTLGQLRNIAPISPENVGYGFIEVVMKALKRLPALSVSYTGVYVLPVAFSYTNLSDTNQVLYKPRNLLASDKVANCQVLDELRVPIIVNKALLLDRPVQEVWGYYK